MKETNIAIIGALDTEISYLQKYLDFKDKGLGNTAIYKGNIGENKVLVAQSYVGKVNAAITAQYLVDKYKPKYLLNIGTAGSLNKNIEIGTIVVADELVQFDYDLSSAGRAIGYVYMANNNSNEQLPTFFKSDKVLSDSLLTFAKCSELKALSAKIGTGDIYIIDDVEKQKYQNMFNIDIMEMEGAAIAQTAMLNDIPFAVVRIISDFGNANEYSKNKANTGEVAGKFLCDYLLKNKV